MSLEKKEFEQVLETLVYDGKVEKTGRVNKKGEMVYKYRCVNAPITSAGAVRIPCGVCPVIYLITDTSRIYFINRFISLFFRSLNDAAPHRQR